MSRRSVKLTACAASGCAMFSLFALAATTTDVSQPFASATTDLTTLSSGTWRGYGSVTAGKSAPYTAPAAGKPISSADDCGVLNVEGYVTCTNALTQSDSNVLVDMMVKVSAPDDELSIPDTDASDIQIAVGVDAGTNLNVYCTTPAGTAAWVALGKYAEGDWIRVSFIFDYTHRRCQLRVNGEPQTTASGYLAATGDTTGGAWYRLVNNPSKFTSMKVVGSTSLDEVLVQHSTASSDIVSSYVLANAESTDASGVKYSWYDANGLAWDGAKTYDASGLTAQQKYMTGLNPTDGSKFEINTMTVSGNTATFTFPAITNPGATVVIESASNAAFTSDTATTAVSGSSASVDLPASGAKRYYRLKATKTYSAGN